MATQPSKLNLADIQMGMEMFAASPDGKTEEQRIRDLIASLPSGELKVDGYWVCSGGRCGACYDCRQ